MCPLDEDRGSESKSADRIAHYRILHQIGRGGQATVYLAEDTHLHRQVALKVLDPGHEIDQERLDRFRREAEITSRLDHPGICAVYEAGEDRGVLWIAMRHVEGEVLSAKIATKKEQATSDTTVVVDIQAPSAPDPARATTVRVEPSSGPKTWIEIARVLALFEHAAQALHVAHEHGVIHRDLKPGNIMVTENGDPVILDFGLAQDVERDLPALTVTGDLVGTPAYMSPEQLAAQWVKLDRRTDVYSLGVSLFECLTLRRPFEGPTRDALYQAIMTKEAPDLRRLNPAIPSDLRVVVATAIEKDRNRRYQTAQDLAEELRRVRMHEPIVAKPVGPLLRLARWAQRNPGLAVALSALFVVLVSGLAIALRLEGRATRKADEAEAARKSLSDSVADYDRLGDLSRLQRLEAEADELWPCAPSKVSAMSEWLKQAAALATRLEGHKEQLESLRKAGQAVLPESRPGASRPTDSRPTDSRPAYLFATDAEQFKHDTTAKLVSDLTAFVDPDPRKGLLADVRARVAFAEAVDGNTIGKYAAEWAEAIRSIANATECPKYRGLRTRPQLGLIPIGRDTSSGLWEFAHLQTTAMGADPIPKRRADGLLAVTESQGLVFVLLPGGTFKMGAMKPPSEDTAPTEPNVDPQAEDRESPVTPVTLDPFFLSKYEITQGQWLRLVGKNPSQNASGVSYGGKMVGLTNPVEQVNWDDCDLWLGRLGLVLPTEAQWEHGARGGTTTPRWTGLGTDGLARAANLADQFAKQNAGPSTWRYESWDDGYKVHAPVGTFAPNPFGLHDVLGNVFEWCRDEYGSYENAPRARDGLRSPPATRRRVYRGGSFNSDASFARSGYRFNFSQEFRYMYLGVRPARSLDP